MQVREAEKMILVSGAVPGCNGSYVVVRPAIKNPAKRIAKHRTREGGQGLAREETSAET